LRINDTSIEWNVRKYVYKPGAQLGVDHFL